MNEPSAAISISKRSCTADPGESARMAGQIGLTTTLGAMIYNGRDERHVIGGGAWSLPLRQRQALSNVHGSMINASGRQKYS